METRHKDVKIYYIVHVNYVYLIKKTLLKKTLLRITTHLTALPQFQTFPIIIKYEKAAFNITALNMILDVQICDNQISGCDCNPTRQ